MSSKRLVYVIDVKRKLACKGLKLTFVVNLILKFSTVPPLYVARECLTVTRRTLSQHSFCF